jgi:hypothetical protein
VLQTLGAHGISPSAAFEVDSVDAPVYPKGTHCVHFAPISNNFSAFYRITCKEARTALGGSISLKFGAILTALLMQNIKQQTAYSVVRCCVVTIFPHSHSDSVQN